MNIIFLGAPGAGKGTQAAYISEHFKIPTISTGEIIRQTLKSGTELGNKLKSYIEKGHLVPDETVIEMVKERISKDDCKNGFILDGFPRTVFQAEKLDEFLSAHGTKIDTVINLEVEKAELIARLTGRRVCKKCGASFHVTNIPPKKEGVCDFCGGELFQRDDDTVETAENRIAVYDSQTKPLVDYYTKAGCIANIDGATGLENVFADIVRALGE